MILAAINPTYIDILFTCLFFVESLSLIHIIIEISFFSKILNHVELLMILKSIMNFDNETRISK